jgi:hypothetical protein
MVEKGHCGGKNIFCPCMKTKDSIERNVLTKIVKMMFLPV